MKYTVINLVNLLNEIGEIGASSILSDFCCPLAPDVEEFLREKAIDFAKRGWAQTHLVFIAKDGKFTLVGYFTLALKVITVPVKNISKSVQRRISSFSTYDSVIDAFCLSAPLIAQLGKNYYNNQNKLITGNDLLTIACDKVSGIMLDLGGRFTYVECEDKSALLDFYKSNGFFEFDRRPLNPKEKGLLSGQHLIQLLRHIK